MSIMKNLLIVVILSEVVQAITTINKFFIIDITAPLDISISQRLKDGLVVIPVLLQFHLSFCFFKEVTGCDQIGPRFTVARTASLIFTDEASSN